MKEMHKNKTSYQTKKKRVNLRLMSNKQKEKYILIQNLNLIY